MRSIREFQETKITFTSTGIRDENVIGTLRDTVDCILEQLQNEECSLAHHVRAVSILLWLVGILEIRRIYLDWRTRDEVEDCAKALIGEYLRRGKYNVEDVLWALEWAPKRTLEEIAPQVPESILENIGDLDSLADLESFADGLESLADGLESLVKENLDSLGFESCLDGLQSLVDRLARLPGFAHLAGLQHLADLHPGLADLACLRGLPHLRGRRGLLGLLSNNTSTTYSNISHCASIARLALDDTAESKR